MKLPKLIACDIDGTLMDYSQSSLSPRLFPLIEALTDRGILFCPASGRQYSSLRRLFAPVKDRLTYLCENGAILFAQDGSILGKTPMDRSLAVDLARDIMSHPNCEVLISGANTSYVWLKEPGLDESLRSFTGNNVTVIQDPQLVPEDILKVSAYCKDGAAKYEAEMKARWNCHFPMAIGGPKWLDVALSDKGVGMDTLLAALDLKAEDVMAFGDNSNDLPMLEKVGMPYVVNRSPLTDLPAHYLRCELVEDVLEELLKHF